MRQGTQKLYKRTQLILSDISSGQVGGNPILIITVINNADNERNNNMFIDFIFMNTTQCNKYCVKFSKYLFIFGTYGINVKNKMVSC